MTGQVCKVGYSLDGLAQAGLVCQNAVEAFLVQVSQPLDTHQLVISQRTVKERGKRKTSLKARITTEELNVANIKMTSASKMSCKMILKT